MLKLGAEFEGYWNSEKFSLVLVATEQFLYPNFTASILFDVPKWGRKHRWYASIQQEKARKT